MDWHILGSQPRATTVPETGSCTCSLPVSRSASASYLVLMSSTSKRRTALGGIVKNVKENLDEMD